ncbi:MAG: NHL repeat-containing protein [Paracoccaceae bacterium]|nr:NHL repeat-containing protein [Paracoccaceae bacterium]
MIRAILIPVLTALPLSLTMAAATAQTPGPFAAFDAASDAVLGNPHGLVFGPDGLLYISDVDNDRVAVMDPDSLLVVREIGRGELSAPHDVDFDAEGRLLVADTGNNRIAVFAGDRLTGSVSGGLARTEGVAVHPNGKLYASSAWAGTLIAFQDGEAVAGARGMSAPHDVAIDEAGNLWVADSNNDRLIKFDPDLNVLQMLDDPSYGWSGPRYLNLDGQGNLVVADKYSHQIKKLAPDGRLIGVIGGSAGKGPGRFRTPEGVAIRGNVLFFSDSGNDRIVRYRVVTN